MYLHERMLNLSAPSEKKQARGYNAASLPEAYENIGFFIYLLDISYPKGRWFPQESE